MSDPGSRAANPDWCHGHGQTKENKHKIKLRIADSACGGRGGSFEGQGEGDHEGREGENGY